MTAPLELTIRAIGTPAPQGSFFGKIVGGGTRGPLRAIVVPDHKATEPWRRAVKAAAETAIRAAAWLPLNEPLSVEIVFFLPRPKAAAKRVWPSVRPDLDKLCRSTFDALTDLVIADDSRIVRMVAEKRYADAGQPCGARIRVTAMSDQLVIV